MCSFEQLLSLSLCMWLMYEHSLHLVIAVQLCTTLAVYINVSHTQVVNATVNEALPLVLDPLVVNPVAAVVGGRPCSVAVCVVGMCVHFPSTASRPSHEHQSIRLPMSSGTFIICFKNTTMLKKLKLLSKRSLTSLCHGLRTPHAHNICECMHS